MNLRQGSLWLSTAVCLLATPALAADFQLNGTSWVQSCSDSPNGSNTMVATFAANTFTSTQTSYASTGCSRNATLTIDLVMGYSLGNDTAVAGARSFDNVVQKVIVTTKSTGQTEAFNSFKFCGKTDWKTNEGVDITNNNCLGIKGGDRSYDVVSLDASANPQKLSFGLSTDDNDASTPAKRPTQLDPASVLSKTK